MIIEVRDEAAMRELGERLGGLLRGGEVIELVGDVGAGKTTLTKAIAAGAGVTDEVQSPTFTLSRIYPAKDNLQLTHYDFYRLSDPGIMAMELHESTNDPQTVTIVEWADVVKGVLPQDTFVVKITTLDENARQLMLESGGESSEKLKKGLA